MLAIAPGWELEVERGPDWLLVRVKAPGGDAIDSPPLAEQVWALLQQHFTYRVVLELEEIEVLNSHLIGQLVRLHRLVGQHDGLMRLCGLSAYNQRVLQTCRLDQRFLSYQDRIEAVMGMCRPHLPR